MPTHGSDISPSLYPITPTMAAGVIYTDPGNIQAYKALIAAQYSGTDLKVAPNFVFGATNKSEEYLKKFPLGEVPAFESTNGKLLLTESNAIAYYVANEALRGRDVAVQTLVWQWTLWADNVLLPASNGWVLPYLGKMQFNNQDVERAKACLLAALDVLESHLVTRTFLVIETVTLADIAVFCTLLPAFQHVVEGGARLSVMRVQHWFKSLACHPQVASVVGQVSLCAAPPPPPPAHSARGGARDHTRHKGAGGGDHYTGKTQRRKKKEPAEEVPPSNNPLDALDAGTFDMDTFKKCFSTEDETTSIQQFWQTFDPEHYSIWYCSYRYPEELTGVLTSCNLITGMFQRLEGMRNHAFASVCVFGADTPGHCHCALGGVWVWRGQDLAFLLDPRWQMHYESFEWRKLDPFSREAKQLVQVHFSRRGADRAGRPFNQGKIFN